MDVAMTKMSSKGQVVIPAEMRKGLHEGDKLIIIRNERQLIMKKATDMDKNMADDIEFAKRTEENPEIGKPMMHARKGTRELYVAPFRLSYAYFKEESKIVFLDFYHKDGQ